MIEVNPKRWKTRPYRHQVEGVRRLVADPHFALFDEMGAGKSKQVVDAAGTLFEAGRIDCVLVIVPASVRGVWLDPRDGEVRKHAWVSSTVVEYHAAGPRVVWSDPGERTLAWVVSNYEYVRPRKKDHSRRNKLLELLAQFRRVMLVLDESSFIASHTSRQWRAVKKIRERCERCVLLNGTPVTNNPLELYPQFDVMDENIFGRFKNFYDFRFRYANVVRQKDRGIFHQKVVGYQNLDELRRLIAPHALRRLKADCLDLPPKTYVTREVPLASESWERYVELRRDAIVTLSEDDVRVEPNAAVKLLRLSQLTSGILGRSAVSAPAQFSIFREDAEQNVAATVTDVSDEKLRWAVDFLRRGCDAPAVIVWTRWVRERERLVEELRADRSLSVYEVCGDQSPARRREAVAAFAVRPKDGDRRMVLVAQPHAGGFGLNLTAASTVVYLSNDYSLRVRLQSEDRCHRPGQTNPVTYVDVLATGPKGQRTVDHTVARALREKAEIAEWTSRAWRRELEEHEKEKP